jgi:hypothetical protein
MFLTPELATYLHDHALTKSQAAITQVNQLTPNWFVSVYDATYREGNLQPLYDSPALFQAKAWILNEPRGELTKYLDVPAFERGDLFYIQNLVATLEAPSSTANDYRTYLSFLPTFNLSANIFDFNTLLKNLFR